MNNKGFTLIELIMVITILGIILLIAVPAVTSIINDSKVRKANVQEKTLEKAAKQYLSSPECFRSLPSSSGSIKITTLQDKGYLPDGIKAPNGGDIPNKACIEVTNDEGKYTYEYKDSSCSGNEITC